MPLRSKSSHPPVVIANGKKEVRQVININILHNGNVLQSIIYMQYTHGYVQSHHGKRELTPPVSLSVRIMPFHGDMHTCVTYVECQKDIFHNDTFSYIEHTCNVYVAARASHLVIPSLHTHARRLVLHTFPLHGHGGARRAPKGVMLVDGCAGTHHPVLHGEPFAPGALGSGDLFLGG